MAKRQPRHLSEIQQVRQEVAAFLHGWELVEPGLVPTVEWLPERQPQPEATPAQAVAYAAIGRLP